MENDKRVLCDCGGEILVTSEKSIFVCANCKKRYTME